MEAVFDHAEQLLQFRDDFSPEDVAFAFKALVALGAKEGLLALQLSRSLILAKEKAATRGLCRCRRTDRGRLHAGLCVFSGSLLMKSDLRCFDCEELLRLTEAFCVAAPVLDAAHSLTQTSQEEKRPLDQRLLQTAYLPAAYEPAPPAKTVCNSPISYRPPNYIPEAPSSPPVKTETFSLGKAKGEDSLVGDKASCVFGVFIPALLQALIAVTPGRLSARQASQALEELAKASLSPPLQSPTGESPSSDASFHQPACEGRQAAQRRRENISSVVERSLRLPLRSDEKKTKGLHPNALLTDRASARSSLS